MGWNTSAFFVSQPVEKILEALQDEFHFEGNDVPFEEASSWAKLDPNVALAPAGKWTTVWCPTYDCVVGSTYEAKASALSRAGAALGVVWSSVAGTHAFRYWRNGKLVREVTTRDGEQINSWGKPLPVERDVGSSSGEQWLWHLISGLTNVNTDFNGRCHLLVPGSATRGSKQKPPKTMETEKPAPRSGSEKVLRSGIARKDDALLYFIKDGDVWAKPRSGTSKTPIKIAELGIEMDRDYIYFLDEDGDIARIHRDKLR